MPRPVLCTLGWKWHRKQWINRRTKSYASPVLIKPHKKGTHSINWGWGVDWEASEGKGELFLLIPQQGSHSSMGLLKPTPALSLAQVRGKGRHGRLSKGDKVYSATGTNVSVV